tara:strand:- start:388 stop:726 length:339 start_codon:yes stop_codon:yes gene_type:complete
MNFLNLLPSSYFSFGLTGTELLLFAIGSLSLLVVLLTYGAFFSKTSFDCKATEKLEPIYSYKDLLLQERKTKIKCIPTGSQISISSRIIVLVLILLVITTPLYQLFKVEHFV